MSNEVDGEWTTGLDYGWPQAMVFVIDVELRDQEALDLARRQVGSAADTLSRIEGVRLSDMGVGLAINETRDRVLAEFDKSTPVDTTATELKEKIATLRAAGLKPVRDYVGQLLSRARYELEWGDDVVLVCDRDTVKALLLETGCEDDVELLATWRGAPIEINERAFGVVAYRRTRLMPSTLDADIEEKS
jgi:hypothetical protein